MLKQIPSWKFTEWMAYHSIEPFGDELIDIHFAELKAMILNTNRAKGSKAAEPKKLRLWKVIEEFNPQQYFEDLKAALTFKQKEE